MEPWGTPEVTGEEEEIALPTRTRCDRSERYEESQWNMREGMPSD